MLPQIVLSEPQRIATLVQLALALEPLTDKEGCTTRYKDLKETKKLEYFVTAGINVGPAFAELTEQLERTRSIRDSYVFLTKAMLLSKNYRGGGKINQGALEFLFPLVCAYVLHQEDTSRLLTMTTKADVDELKKMKYYGNIMSDVVQKYPVHDHAVATVYDYYAAELAISEKYNEKVHNSQFVHDYKDIRFVIERLSAHREKTFSERVQCAYNELRELHQQKIGVGLAADFIAAGLFVTLTKEERMII